MDIIITGEDSLIKAQALTNGLGRIVTISTYTEETTEIVEHFKEIGAKGLIFNEIPDLNTLRKTAQAAQLYRDQTGLDITAVYCMQNH